MATLFYAAMTLFVAAVAVTVYAAAAAQEGFEDEDGFHALRRDKRSAAPRKRADKKEADDDLPPLAVH